MAHYRKIDIRIWLDQKFNGLSSDSQFVFLYLLTHPQLTALGAMRSTLPGLAAELDWPLDRFTLAFEVLARQDMVAVDQKACFVWAINFLKYNPPESPNVVKSWGTCLAYLPECDLKNQLIQKTRHFLETLSITFQEALPTGFELTTQKVTSNEATTKHISESHPLLDSNLPATLTKALVEEANLIQESLEVTTDSIAQSNASIDSEYSIILPRTLLEEVNPIKGSLSERLPEGFQEGLPEAFAKTSLNHKALNKKHKTLSIKPEQEQKEKRLIQEKNLEEKEKIEEIKNIVAPLLQKNSKPPDAEIVQVFSYWKQTLGHPQAMLDAKRRKRIRQALASGYSAAQLCDAILGCSYTPHNMGDNEQGQRYDSVHVIFRDADQIDRFIRNAHSPPRPQNAADRLMNTNFAAGQRWIEKKRREMEKTVYESI